MLCRVGGNPHVGPGYCMATATSSTCPSLAVLGPVCLGGLLCLRGRWLLASKGWLSSRLRMFSLVCLALNRISHNSGDAVDRCTSPAIECRFEPTSCCAYLLSFAQTRRCGMHVTLKPCHTYDICAILSYITRAVIPIKSELCQYFAPYHPPTCTVD